MYEEKKKRER